MDVLRFRVSMTLLVVPLLITVLSQTRTVAALNYLYHSCPNETTFIANSTYQANRDSLLASLSSNATSSGGFYNATAGSSFDKVYGLFLCRGDLSGDDCRDLVDGATKDVVDRCPNQKVAVAWYDGCMIRYSNESIFSNMVTAPNFSLSNSATVGEPDQFDLLVRTMMNDLARWLSSNGTGVRKFGTKEANFTSVLPLYSLAQCTPDLSGSDCNMCLQQAISGLRRCCSGKLGARVLYPSCTVGVEVNTFYASGSSVPPSPASPPPPGSVTTPAGKEQVSAQTIIAIVVPVSISILVFVGYCFLKRRAKKKYNVVPKENVANDITTVTNDIMTVESLQFDLATIKVATNTFSDDNKLGKGGFGVVYKGVLPNGQEIAVKRLSTTSQQGVREFTNEVVLVAKLQHRNLVRLLGFCFEGNEKILIYEFMPNKSLDNFLYDHTRKEQLNWATRYKIIGGLARGMLYLHEDSRLRIIHRDLKPSNVLLDHNLNPKISDFGMAKILGVDQTQGNTSRIVGTYDYMSPEYAMHGELSMKSDIYSFGILVLEILTGKKISSFDQSDGAGDLLSYAWKHWKNGTPLELLDPNLGDSYSRNEVVRCLQIGLLCVHDDPGGRPTMASIVLMLESYSATFPTPQCPTLSLRRTEENMMSREFGSGQSTSTSMPLSVNETSITEIVPR